MCNEVINYIKPQQNGIYCDLTFGQGGYSHKFLKEKNCSVIAIDRDQQSEVFANSIKNKFKNNFYFKIDRFSNLKNIVNEFNFVKVDGIMLDLGVSNTQLDQAKRGFSFSKKGPLNMKMEFQNKKDISAEDIINDYSEKKLCEIFYKYGEERNSFKIGRAINEARKIKRITTTCELAEIISKVNFKNSYRKIHPATKVFQALRIYVNNELTELEVALENSIEILKLKSRIAVVSFHSLEDRIVKNFFRNNSGYFQNNYKHLPEKKNISNSSLKIITKKAIKPSLSEITLNPRSRSAKLRVAEKI